MLSSLSKMNIIFAISFAVFDLLLALLIILNKNAAISYIINAVSIFMTVTKLLIGYIILSKVDLIERGIPRLTWVHLWVILMSFWGSVYLCKILYRNYKIIEKHPIPKAKKEIEKHYRIPKWLPIAVLISNCPIVFARVFARKLANFGFGMGFGLILLACVFCSAMLVPCLFKCIVIIRFKVYKFF